MFASDVIDPTELMKDILIDYLSVKKNIKERSLIKINEERKAINSNPRITSAFLIYDIASYRHQDIDHNQILWRGIMLMVLEHIMLEYKESYVSQTMNFISSWGLSKKSKPEDSELYKLYKNAIKKHAQCKFSDTELDQYVHQNCIKAADEFLLELRNNDKRFASYRDFILALHNSVYAAEMNLQYQ